MSHTVWPNFDFSQSSSHVAPISKSEQFFPGLKYLSLLHLSFDGVIFYWFNIIIPPSVDFCLCRQPCTLHNNFFKIIVFLNLKLNGLESRFHNQHYLSTPGTQFDTTTITSHRCPEAPRLWIELRLSSWGVNNNI